MSKSVKKSRFCKLDDKQRDGDIDSFVELVSKPRFYCDRCSRVSGLKQNLCKPKKLKST